MPEDTERASSFFASSAERDLPHPDQGSNHGDASSSA
jgi:hypothetical protein